MPPDCCDAVYRRLAWRSQTLSATLTLTPSLILVCWPWRWAHDQVAGTDKLASGGLGSAAHWLFSEVYPHLRRLMGEGYTLSLLGHSLGGAVAALLGVLLREEGITEGE